MDLTNKRDDVVPYLDEVANVYTGNDLQGFALALSVPYLESAENYHQAVERCQNVRGFYRDKEVNKDLLFIMAMIYFYGLQDQHEAKLYFEEYIQNYPNEPMTKTAQDMLEIMNSRVLLRPQAENVPVNISPEEYVLYQNYPNPFNPRTNIQFELPEAAHVELVIYNLLGQKLKTLVSNDFQAGRHHLVWDGTSDNGQRVGSGTYLFLLRATSDNKILFQHSKKMSFIK